MKNSPLQRRLARLRPILQFFAGRNLRRFLLLSWIRLRTFCRRDRATKRNCLLIAVALFFFIQNVLQKEKTFSVEVIPSFDAGLTSAISAITPSEVQITIRGPRDTVQSFLDTKNVSIRVSARPETLKNQTLKLTRWNVQGINDRSLSVVKISPKRVAVTFDEPISKTFTISPPRFINKPLLKDYSASIANRLPVITVRGAKSILDTISDSIVFKTDPIDLRGKSGDFETTVRILDLPHADRVQWEPTEFTARVSLSDTSASNSFEKVDLLLAAKSGDASRYVAKPETVRVWVKGNKGDVAKVSHSNIVAIASCIDPPKSIGPHGKQIPVRAAIIHGPQDLSIWTEPASVHVSILEDCPSPPPSAPEPDRKSVV